MPTFFIGTPGGYEVEVKAADQAAAVALVQKEWQSMPRILERYEDGGRVLERSNGTKYFISPGYATTDPETVADIMKTKNAGKVSRDRIDQSLIDQNPVAARGTAYARGFPGARGYVDEAIGAAFGEDAKVGTRALAAAQERQNPGETFGLNMAGAITGTAGLVAAAPAAVTTALGAPMGMRLLPGMAAAAGIGGGTGLIEGMIAGFGEGTEGNRGAAAVQGAKDGAMFGAIGGPVGQLAGKGINNVAGRLMRSDVAAIQALLGISRDAAKVIRNVFDQGGDERMAFEALQRAGDQAMLADAGEAAQALLDATKASGGGAAQTVSKAVDDRAERTAKSLNDTLDRALGKYDPEMGPQSTVAAISERTAGPRKEAYDYAYGQPIDDLRRDGINSALQRIEPVDLIKAVDRANAQLRADGLFDQIITLKRDPQTGDIMDLSNLNVQQLDTVKRMLGAGAQDALGEFGAQTVDSRRLGGLAAGLRRELGGVEGYDNAVQLGGDKIAEEGAYKLGRQLLQTTTEVEDVILQMGDRPTNAALEAARQGLRSYLGKTIGDVRAVISDPSLDAKQVQAVLRATTSENSRLKIAKLLPKEEADMIFRELAMAEQTMLVRNATAKNSATASRLAIQGTVEDITAPGWTGDLMAGEPINTAKALIQAVTGQTKEYTAKRQQEIYVEIAKALTTKQGPEAVVALKAITEAIKGQPMKDADAALIGQLLGLGAGSAASTTGLATQQRMDRVRN